MYYMPLLYAFLMVGPAIAGIAFSRRLSASWHWFLSGLCILYGVTPLLMTWSAYGLAKNFGCSVESIRFRCSSPGWLGDVLSGLSMSHWLLIFVIPSAVLGMIGLLISWVQTSKQLNSPSVFHRSRHRVFGGVCGALAPQWNLPVLGVRIVTATLAILIPGFIFLYVWCWLAFPIEPRSQQPLGEQS